MLGILLDKKILLREKSINIERDFDFISITIIQELYFGVSMDKYIKEKTANLNPLNIVIEKANDPGLYSSLKDSSSEERMKEIFKAAVLDLDEINRIREELEPIPAGFGNMLEFDRSIPDSTMYQIMDYCKDFKTKELIVI